MLVLSAAVLVLVIDPTAAGVSLPPWRIFAGQPYSQRRIRTASQGRRPGTIPAGGVSYRFTADRKRSKPRRGDTTGSLQCCVGPAGLLICIKLSTGASRPRQLLCWPFGPRHDPRLARSADSHQSSECGRRRFCLRSDRAFLFCSRRSFEPRVRRVGRRLTGAWATSSSKVLSRSRQSCVFLG